MYIEEVSEHVTTEKVDPLSQLTFNGKPFRSPEVKVPNPKKRRKHTAEYKLRILKEADLRRNEPGGISALLRREGLYASALHAWSEQRTSGALSALSQSRGRKPIHTPVVLEIQQLRKDKSRLEEKLRQAELIIDIQKKVAAMLGIPMSQDEKNL